MRFWIPALVAAVLLACGGVSYYLWAHYEPPPDIHGAYLQPARKLGNFSLLNHRQSRFDREDLKGRWHLVTYGYTHCPDICPMTLSTLSQWVQRLEQNDVYPDLQVLFYSVDGERDTPEVLEQYVPYFHSDFIGLTPGKHGGHKSFEQGLGIVSREPSQGPWLNHGVMIMLLNPRAQLQAVFRPERNERGLFHFRGETLFRDYQAVRRYYERHGSNG
ncbi:SCO family protein [Marinimicrobium locisalis]|uniref:SCO family protein n=1 Tax=Marinimicrobium locisalis TaxID=546022 RepID=UPI0032216D75